MLCNQAVERPPRLRWQQRGTSDGTEIFAVCLGSGLKVREAASAFGARIEMAGFARRQLSVLIVGQLFFGQMMRSTLTHFSASFKRSVARRKNSPTADVLMPITSAISR
jgi:hypothetical protein